MKRRATVVIRQRDREAEDGYQREWTHAADLEENAYGVTVRWPQDGCEVLIPWPSIVRIDFEPCRCSDCKRLADQLENVS
jgi:hypothetical protein